MSDLPAGTTSVSISAEKAVIEDFKALYEYIKSHPFSIGAVNPQGVVLAPAK